MTTFSCNTKGVLSVQPLVVRPAMQRMDMLPFLLAYALVALFLVDWSLPEDELSIRYVARRALAAARSSAPAALR